MNVFLLPILLAERGFSVFSHFYMPLVAGKTEKRFFFLVAKHSKERTLQNLSSRTHQPKPDALNVPDHEKITGRKPAFSIRSAQDLTVT